MIEMLETQTGHVLPAIHDGTEYRFLGRIINPNKTHRFKMFSDYLMKTGNPLVDLTTLNTYDRFQKNVPILSQGAIGSCVGHGHCSMVLKARDLQGMTLELLSADSLYAQIDNDQDQGSDPADAVRALETNGICLLSDVPDNFILWSNISEQAKQNALRFKIPSVSVYQCHSFAELVTADYLGFATTLTVNCGNDFNNLDSNGIVPLAPGTANHCVSGGESAVRLSNGTIAYRFRNSWQDSWGINGCAFITERHITSQNNSAEMYALMWTNSDPEDVPGNVPNLT